MLGIVTALSLAVASCRQVVVPHFTPPPAKSRYFTVPMVAPSTIDDSTWLAVSAPANILDHTGGFNVKVIRNTLSLQFTSDATQAERQRIVDSAHVQVIGGLSFNAYYVQLTDSIPTNPDSAADLLLRTVAYLRSEPHVKHVALHILDGIVPTN
jgi:hypothetical protein